MHIISKKTLLVFWSNHPTAESSLRSDADQVKWPIGKTRTPDTKNTPLKRVSGNSRQRQTAGPHPLNPPRPTLGEGEDLTKTSQKSSIFVSKTPPLPELGEGVGG